MNLTRKDVDLIIDCINDSITADEHYMRVNASPHVCDEIRVTIDKKSDLLKKLREAKRNDILFTSLMGSPS